MSEDNYTSLAIEFWNSDFILTARGVLDIRALLMNFLPVMRDEQFYGPAPSYIGVTLRDDFVDIVSEYLITLLFEPGVVMRLPVTSAEITHYIDMATLYKKQYVENVRKALA